MPRILKDPLKSFNVVRNGYNFADDTYTALLYRLADHRSFQRGLLSGKRENQSGGIPAHYDP